MLTPSRKTLKTAAALIVIGASLSACAPGFHAEDGVLQSQSNLTDIEKPVPDDSLQQIQHDNDPAAQSQDPILSQPTNKNTSYKLPENSVETIRVRLLPITSSHPDDAFLNSEKVDNVVLMNENGLVLKDLASASSKPVSGKLITILFSRKQVIVDGQTSVLDSNSQLGIFPRNAGSLTQVSLKLNEARLAKAKIPIAKPGELPFRGLFVLRQQARAAAKGQAPSAAWNLINYVSLDDYVRAVVPSEIGAGAPAEALKAQALAARTYALHEMILARCIGHATRCAPRVWDVDPSTQYQSFIGGMGEKQATFAAIDATKDQLLSYKGAPILAMFHASSGGETVSGADYACKGASDKTRASCEKAYGPMYPYLPAQKDPFNGTAARFGHGVGLPQVSAKQMASAGHLVSEIVAQYYPGTSIEKIDGK